jgi:hypothetical protein
MNVIAQTNENYLCFSAYLAFPNEDGKRSERFRVKFADSYQLMNSSLSTLASNLVKGTDFSKLKHAMAMRHNYPLLTEADLAAKGIFPYSYVDSWNRLEEKGIPPKAAFYDTLSETISVTDEEYQRACKMYNSFNCNNLFDYQLRYLEVD